MWLSSGDRFRAQAPSFNLNLIPNAGGGASGAMKSIGANSLFGLTDGGLHVCNHKCVFRTLSPI